MVISFLRSGGVKCSASGFNLVVDPAVTRTSLGDSPEEEQNRLILKTESTSPLNFPLPSEIILTPGEYEISGIKIKGIELEKEATPQKIVTAYVVNIDEMRLCFLGGITKELEDEALDKLENIDILFLPVGSPFISLRQALNLIKQIDPRVVIPLAGKEVGALAKEFGVKSEPQEKIAIKSKDLEEGTKLIWLGIK